MTRPLVGVLALQGASQEHIRALASLGADTVEVRVPADLAGVQALVLPGGESTTMSMLLESSDLFGPIAELVTGGMPTFGTCAGMILLASNVLDGRPDQRNFSAIDITVRRNAFGRQVASFETDLAISGLADTFRAVFIRAPGVVNIGPDVEVLATVDVGDHADVPVLCRSGSILVSSFHPELTNDTRLHQLLLDQLALTS
ncbi:MAG: 5'-phosphate synthase pdxT subunit [Candidatus Poriferisodalaceae bacterium]|jgi:5'-phosphate synthase pdxT subunit